MKLTKQINSLINYSYQIQFLLIQIFLHNEVLSPITKRRKGKCHFSPKINLFNISYNLKSVDLNVISIIHSSEVITRLKRCQIYELFRHLCVQWCQERNIHTHLRYCILITLIKISNRYKR